MIKPNNIIIPAVVGLSVLAGCTSSSEKQLTTEQGYAHPTPDTENACNIGIDTKILDNNEIARETTDGELIYGNLGTDCHTGNVVTDMSGAEITAFNREVKSSRKEWLALANQAIALADNPVDPRQLAKDPPQLREGNFTTVAAVEFDNDTEKIDSASAFIPWPDYSYDCDYGHWGMPVKALGEISGPSSDNKLSAFLVLGKSAAKQCDEGTIIVADEAGNNLEFKTPGRRVSVKTD